MLSFGNPLGFFALAAIPIILAIHFLQRESRRVLTSTLFLLEQLAPESAQGRRFERLRNSVPLWLQILAALVVTWLLVQPRWLRRDSTQRVVIVLDSSISMSAFRDELLRNVETQTARLQRAAMRTEWQLLESDTSRPPLYSGGERSALLESLQQWKPHLGAHDFLPALQMGQMLLRGTGTLLFVSDRKSTLPNGVHLLAVGQPLENCGFAGANFQGTEWHALIRNYGREVQRRNWWIEAKGQRSPARELELQPGQSSAITGSIPEGADACEVVLNADAFTLDDRLPLVRPEPKRLSIARQTNPAYSDFFAQFAASLENVVSGMEHADVSLNVYDPFLPGLPDSTAIVFVSDPAPSKTFLPGAVVAENHPLSAELNWAGLLCRDSFRVPAKPGDQTLVWQGERPLIFLRENGRESLLVINFDLQASNAARLPPFVLLLHRFVERVRAAKIASEARNVDTNQILTVASDPALPPPMVDNGSSETLRAPASPGFFKVRQGDTILLRAAAQFADAREADFREATSFDGVQDAAASVAQQNSEADILAPLWIMALGAVMVGSWTWRRA